MTRIVTRRRFLTISAAACALRADGAAALAPESRWRGAALGAKASVRIAGLAPEAAAPILIEIEQELQRLEGIFSLYRSDSALVRLNAHGRLPAPPPELLEVLSLSSTLHRATGAAFDPTVQPLFAAFARAAAEGRTPDAQALAQARRAVGWEAVRFDTEAVELSRKGAGLTLNGVAQGYITDRIADLLRGHGLTDVLVDAGEVAARGHRPDGDAWVAGIAAPDGMLLRRLTLTDRALATSAPKGTVLDPRGRLGHIFDPARGAEAEGASLVSVSAPRAALADGLSTALCVVPPNRHEDMLKAFPGAGIEFAA